MVAPLLIGRLQDPVGDHSLQPRPLGELTSARWAAVLPSIIDTAERDSELDQLQAELHAQLVEPFLAAAARALQSGDLAAGRSPVDVVAAVLGPLFYRRWFTRHPLEPQYVEAAVDAAVRPHGTT